jgi:hypothetical protein
MRVCEEKSTPNGERKLNVPEALHKAWADSDPEKRQKMAQMLAACDFKKEIFIKRAVKTFVRSKTVERVVIEGWYSGYQMEHELGWSKLLGCI